MRALLWPWLALYAAFVRWCIWEAESHLRECAADGILEGRSLRAFRSQVDADRVRLADIHARMQASLQALPQRLRKSTRTARQPAAPATPSRQG